MVVSMATPDRSIRVTGCPIGDLGQAGRLLRAQVGGNTHLSLYPLLGRAAVTVLQQPGPDPDLTQVPSLAVGVEA